MDQIHSWVNCWWPCWRGKSCSRWWSWWRHQGICGAREVQMQMFLIWRQMGNPTTAYFKVGYGLDGHLSLSDFRWTCAMFDAKWQNYNCVYISQSWIQIRWTQLVKSGQNCTEVDTIGQRWTFFSLPLPGLEKEEIWKTFLADQFSIFCFFSSYARERDLVLLVRLDYKISLSWSSNKRIR